MTCDVRDNLASDADREERLSEVLLAYVEAVQGGRQPDRRELLAAHPDLRSDLETFFAGHDEVERLAAPLRVAAAESLDEQILLDDPDDRSDAAAGERADDAPGDAKPLGRLGDFRLLREVGRGGMGVVYEAEQISLERRVALKILPFAAAIDPRQLQRFKNEALAAAHLRHESIVPVHAVGCERGVHYHAMQFIDGQSLAALIAELRRRGGEDGMTKDEMTNDEGRDASRHSDIRHSSFTDTVGPSLAAPDTKAEDAPEFAAESISRQWSSGSRRYFDWVARLGRQAALALEHAHQMGIVHRDVKPGNLLLDARGQLWITDFGLAQVVGDAGLTATGEMLGTLRYASPEQARVRPGIVDHRSDIYSLGATLYELVTLRPLFEGRDRHELLRRIADVEPTPPRSLAPSAPVELETIVLKALRKDPAERYATAQELADDLQRFLEHCPILARRPTVAERLRKWAWRHPSLIAAATVVMVLLSAGSLASAALIRGEQARTKAEQRKVEEAYQREQERARQAEARFQLARSSIDELIEVSEEELIHRPGMEGLRKRLLTSALAYYEQLVQERPDEPGEQADLLDTTRRVERILADLAALRAASQFYLLGQPSALDDLGLDGEQRAKVKELAARVYWQWMESVRAIGRVSPAQRARRALRQARANEAELAKVLTQAQQDRLRQIKLQWEVPGSFRDPEIVTALRLTTEQRDRIRTVEEEVRFRTNNTWPGFSPRKSENSGDAKDKPAGDRILAVLDDEQLQHWGVLTGQPLKNPFGSPFAPSAAQRDAKAVSP